jgi:hypothetical protein
MTRGPLVWPVAIVLSGASLDVLVAADAGGPLRLVAAAWFLLVCLGMAFVPLLSIRDRTAELATAVALSLALGALATTCLAAAGQLTAANGLIALNILCLVGCSAQVWRLAWSP